MGARRSTRAARATDSLAPACRRTSPEPAARRWTGLGWIALLAFAAGCTSTSESQLPGPESALIRHADASKGWRVRDDGRLAGSLLLYSDPHEPSAGYYSVRNTEGQTLGLVDFEGRAWRYRLHQQEPDWLGTGTVLEGVRRILETSALTLLEEAPLAGLGRGG